MNRRRGAPLGWLRPFSLALHKYAGLAAGAVIVVVGVSGAILVFAEPLNRALYPELWEVEVGAERLSPDSVHAVVREAYRERSANTMHLATDPTEPYRVQLQGGLVVYVDPYRGVVLGEHDLRRSFTGLVEGLHTSLLIGDVGLWAVVGSTIVLLALLLTGYVLWWPRTKRESKRSFTVQWRAGWKRFVYDAHNVFGFYASGYLILMALTGVLLSFPILARGVYRLTGTERPAEPPRSALVADGATPITLGEAVRAAEAAVAAGETVVLSIPARPRQAIRVGLLVAGSGNRNQNAVFVDQFSGAVLRVDRPEDRSTVTRTLALTFPIHSGNLFGLPTQVAAFVVSMVGGILPLTGFLIWYPRWRAKRRRRA